MSSTKQQLDVIYHRLGNALVRAVAGSGKTTTLVNHIISLIKEGMNPSRIFVIVFNDSASKDFTSKLRKKNVLILPKVRTFHSIGKRIYDNLVVKGFLPYFELDDSEYKAERLAIQSLLNIYKTIRKDDYPDKDEIENFISFIDLIKADLKLPEHVFEDHKFSPDRKYYISAYHLFERERKKLKFRTFSDLIHTPVHFFIENPDILNDFKGFIDLLLLDEVQDINEISFRLMKQIATEKTRWLLVGDEDQCIYEWRGAKPEYITHKFKEELFPLKEYKMTKTFRYGHELSLAANNLITNNVNRTNKICVSGKEDKTQIFINQYESDIDVGYEICNIIKSNHSGNELRDFAILIRLYSYSIPIELAMLEAEIPYFVKDRGSLFKVKEIVAFATYLELIAGTLFGLSDELLLVKLNALVSTPFCGIKIRLKLEQISLFRENPISLSEFVLGHDNPKLSKFKRNKLQQIAYCFRYALTKGSQFSAANALKFYLHTTELLKTYEIFLAKQEDVDNKVFLVKSFIMYLDKKDVTPLQAIKLLKHLEDTQLRYAEQSEDAIIISSIHKAKGLEWKNVIIPSLEERKFPYYCDKKKSDIESERRLFYVAATRAEDKLFLLSPRDDEFLYHIKNNKSLIPLKPVTSRFLYELKVSDAICNAIKIYDKKPLDTNNELLRAYEKEIDNKQMTDNESVAYDISKIDQKYPSTTPYHAEEINQGMEIYHLKHKLGHILSKKGNIVIVNFFIAGVKSLNIKEELVFPSLYVE